MEEIDWSKSPEGATHYYYASGEWYKKYHDEWMVWYPIAQKWEKSRAELQYRALSAIARSDQWSGPQDGLPPVGQRCEIVNDTTGEWLAGKVIAHGIDEGAEQAVIQCDDAIWMGHAHEFRPISTQAQIEEDERERAACDMFEIIDSALPSVCGEEAMRYSRALYDAGYRRIEK